MITLILVAAVSWPGQYNAGVTAYRSNDFTSAAATFEQATASPDRALQQRAFYNLGNTDYRLGEADPTKAQPLWERAIKNYETALALDPKDEDAKFNHDYVKKKLEELKKQQERQQEQQKKEQENKQQSTGGEAKQSQPDQQPNQPNQQEQAQQKQQPRRGRPPDEQEQQQAQQQPMPDESQEKQQPPEQQPQQAQPGNLDKQQAKALLDNLREDERNWNFFPEVQMKDLKDAGEPAKDW